MRRIIFVVCLTCVAVQVSCTGKNSVSDTIEKATDVSFESFYYQGDDNIFKTPVDEGQIQNPILNGFYPDPSIVRVDDSYYMVTSTFGFFPGLPVFHSKDLKHWQQLRNAIDRPEQLNFDGLHLGYNGIYAPAIEYRDGTFYIITTCVGCGGNFIVTTKDPTGPWSDPIWLPELEGIDPSLFFDGDKTYIVHHKNPINKKYDAHTTIALMEVDSATFQPVSNDVTLVDGDTPAPWHTEYLEGPHIYKHQGYYYLSASGGGTEFFHSYLFYRAKNIGGPYEPNMNNPVLTQAALPDDRINPITATGHGDIFQDTLGNWWVVFLANRVYNLDKIPQGLSHTGRETFLLPVYWDNDGWPEVLAANETVPLRINRPPLTPVPLENAIKVGNDAKHYTFDDNALTSEWLFIRAPHETWWQVSQGALKLKARNDVVGDYGQPSFIGRRLSHLNATVSTTLSLPMLKQNDEAGLLALQNDDSYLAFGVYISDDATPTVRVRARKKSEEGVLGQVLVEEPVELSANLSIALRIHISESTLMCDYRIGNGDVVLIDKTVSSGLLTSQEAGGFTGAVVGMYAHNTR